MSIRANVDARALDQRIRIDRKIVIQGADGGETHTWNPIANIWGRVDGAKASGAEPSSGDGIRSVSDYTMWIRAELVGRLGLTVLDRVFWKGAPYNIADMPDQQKRGRLIALIVRTGDNDG